MRKADTRSNLRRRTRRGRETINQAALPVSGGAMIRLDQAPLRAAARQDCLQAFAAIEKVQIELQQYDEIDLPAYSGWVRRRFSTLLGRIRETAEKMADLEFLVDSVERLAIYSGCSYQEAYDVIMEEKRQWESGGQARARAEAEAEALAQAQAEEDAARSRGPGEPTEEKLRQAFDELYGAEPDAPDFDPGNYETAFAEFKRFFREREAEGAGEGGSDEDDSRARGSSRQERPERDAGAGHGHRPGHGDSARAVPPPGSRDHDLRLKDRYRRLARILHPDLTEPTARKKELWLQVQDAYGKRDLHALDQLLLLSELAETSPGGSTLSASISEMLALVRRLKDSVKPLKRKLREVRRSPAWEFSRRKSFAELEALTEGELQQELESFRRRSSILEKTLSHWSRPLKRGTRAWEDGGRSRPQRPGSSAGRGARSSSGGQAKSGRGRGRRSG